MHGRSPRHRLIRSPSPGRTRARVGVALLSLALAAAACSGGGRQAHPVGATTTTPVPVPDRRSQAGRHASHRRRHPRPRPRPGGAGERAGARARAGGRVGRAGQPADRPAGAAPALQLPDGGPAQTNASPSPSPGTRHTESRSNADTLSGPVPDLAGAQPKITDGGRMATITLRTVRWDVPSGRRVTATDELRALKRLCLPQISSPVRGYLEESVVGYAAACRAAGARPAEDARRARRGHHHRPDHPGRHDPADPAAAPHQRSDRHPLAARDLAAAGRVVRRRGGHQRPAGLRRRRALPLRRPADGRDVRPVTQPLVEPGQRPAAARLRRPRLGARRDDGREGAPNSCSPAAPTSRSTCRATRRSWRRSAATDALITTPSQASVVLAVGSRGPGGARLGVPGRAARARRLHRRGDPHPRRDGAGRRASPPPTDDLLTNLSLTPDGKRTPAAVAEPVANPVARADTDCVRQPRRRRPGTSRRARRRSANRFPPARCAPHARCHRRDAATAHPEHRASRRRRRRSSLRGWRVAGVRLRVVAPTATAVRRTGPARRLGPAARGPRRCVTRRRAACSPRCWTPTWPGRRCGRAAPRSAVARASCWRATAERQEAAAVAAWQALDSTLEHGRGHRAAGAIEHRLPARPERRAGADLTAVRQRGPGECGPWFHPSGGSRTNAYPDAVASPRHAFPGGGGPRRAETR